VIAWIQYIMDVQKICQFGALQSHDSVYFECNHKGVAQALANQFLWEIQKVPRVY
jgi:hypothetical protein